MQGVPDRLCEEILANYRAMERFEEGARFLEEFGWAEEDEMSSRKRTRVLEGIDEAFAMLAGIKAGSE